MVTTFPTFAAPHAYFAAPDTSQPSTPLPAAERPRDANWHKRLIEGLEKQIRKLAES